ncbi:uncharacterized protein PV06_00371 [Exophiala oligosperma]|uniref:Sugar phosphate transporter domain-containing protein n=1 Tax=Exophiala oligosperma TaxID=215243 RepID=A0A0D2CCQ5_9EURO|nr:uncharacterized protein PV06_00371 [Exophiala oligosperma]KIW47702.1 hypothetical protein PV06_00371 [Exophiala oligosperma]
MADQSPSRLSVAATVAFHITTAIAVTIVNKSVLNTLPVPITLLLAQSVISTIILCLAYMFRLYVPAKLDSTYIRGVAPLLAIKIIAQLSKTYCLLNVNASFYQIARGLLLPFTIFLSFMFLKDSRPSMWASAACAITTLGFVLGVSGEAVGQATNIGIAWGIWSSLTTALETVLVKYLALKTRVLDLVFVTSLAGIPVFSVLAYLNSEMSHLSALGTLHPVMVTFEKKVLLSGLFNFALSAAAYLQIRVTSPTTHMISTAARGVLQSALAVVFLGAERLTASRIKSIAVILTGTMLYTFIKDMEKRGKTIKGQILPLHTTVSQPQSTNPTAGEEGVPLVEPKGTEEK